MAEQVNQKEVNEAIKLLQALAPARIERDEIERQVAQYSRDLLNLQQQIKAGELSLKQLEDRKTLADMRRNEELLRREKEMGQLAKDLSDQRLELDFSAKELAQVQKNIEEKQGELVSFRLSVENREQRVIERETALNVNLRDLDNRENQLKH